ncbi:MAG: phage-shock protein [Eubacteriales bacterium]|nr:phage-shock protein [Bacillota bacterium]MBV1726884.1 phage-shock protein [Desulforudis sp.]MDQ7788583.1 phage-shock protein [Clostridia bacterium]MDZ4043096.1 phage-shock protein [Eubacteriales bacterium]MBV1736057.1 phage-shock protein [Desulforudis sp.]
MSGNLHSLTDVLKRTLFFFEAMSAKELAPYVRRKMLQDYSLAQVEEKVYLCLKQHNCFDHGEDRLWRLNLQGVRENDHFYHLLLKKQQPLSLWEIVKSNQSKKKKLRRMIAEEANLISDGRFIQLDNGLWGLTEWDVEVGQFPLKHLIIKAFRLHPGGLSLAQLVGVVNTWRPTTETSAEAILSKFPYFEQQGESLWQYNQVAHRVYDEVMKKYLAILREQKRRWQWEREQWYNKYQQVRNQYEEVGRAQREVAAALAEHAVVRDRNDHLVTQISEKDLLLSLRKKEILYYQDQVKKLEAKANSVLYQCRLWVQRTRDTQEEVESRHQSLEASQANLEGMFSKLQQSKEKYREAKAQLAQVKDEHSSRLAELQGEIIDLKSRLEKQKYGSSKREKLLEEEIDRLQADLKDALEAGEDLQRSVRYLQQEVSRVREEYRDLERVIKHPLVRLAVRVRGVFAH